MSDPCNDELRPSPAVRVANLALGWLCVGLGLLGLVLPVVPTTPFLLIAAWAFARSSQRFHDWLLNHRRLGPPVRAWRQHGIVPTRAKVAALSTMAASLSYVTLFLADDWLLPLAAGAPMAATAAWLVTRPGRAPEKA